LQTCRHKKSDALSACVYQDRPRRLLLGGVSRQRQQPEAMTILQKPTGARGRVISLAGALLTHPCLPAFAAALTLLLTLPALNNGWMLDDYYHRTVLLGTSRFRDLFGPPEEMFRFFRGGPSRTTAVMDLGFFPWWTFPGLKAEFCQVLTVPTHQLDYWLWQGSPHLMHAHSLVWLAALVAAVAWLYRQILGPTWVAGAAALLFAVDDARGACAGFLANRNVLVAGFFGALAVAAHHAWRERGRGPALVLAPLLLAASLFAKEEGIGTCAYLAAYGLWLDRSGWKRGSLALAPYLGVVLLWRSVRAQWGYGVADMGLYVDPLTDPGPFARAVVSRLPPLLLGQWGFPPSDITAFLGPTARALHWWAAVVFLTVLFVLLSPLLRQDRRARFWATGMVLAAIPVCATFPMNRLLTFPGIGAFGLLAQFLGLALGNAQGRTASLWWRRPAVALAWALLVIHGVLAPLALPVRAANPLGPKSVERRFYVPPSLAPSEEGQTVVVVNAPSPVHACCLPLVQDLNHAAVPRHTRVLAPAFPAVTIRRVDDRSLAIRPEGGYLRWPMDRIFRSEQRPLRLHEKIVLSGMSVEVTELTEAGDPAEALFRFDVPLEDRAFRWLCYRDKGYELFRPPDLGETVEVRVGPFWGDH
jgi:hypothetical protein